MGDLREGVALESVRANKVALRQVDRTSEAYLGLVESLKLKGFGGAITGRLKVDPDTKEEFIEIIDGLHRYTACKDAGIPTINVDVQEMTDDEVLVSQILANVHKVETKAAEYAEQLKRMMGLNPLLTETELATQLGKSPKWIKDILGLNKIKDEKIKTLINNGKIPLMNAYALAKLPVEEQATWLDRAMTQKPKEFVPQANDRAKEVRDAGRKGKKAGGAKYEPKSHARKLKDIQAAAADRNFVKQLLDSNGVTNPVDAGVLVLNWCQHLDPASKAEAIRKNEEAKERRKAEIEQRKKDREAKKAEEAEAAKEAAAKEAAAAYERAVHGS